MRHSAPTFPYPGGPGFADLAVDDQQWVALVRPWYNQAATQLSPTLSLDDAMVDAFRRDPAQHWPKLVAFYLTSPRVFEVALRHLTGVKVPGSTAKERQEAWRLEIEKLARQGWRAAE